LGAPIQLTRGTASTTAHAAGSGLSITYSYHDLRPHSISIGNDGAQQAGGNYGTSAQAVELLFRTEIPHAIGPKSRAKYRHLLLDAHGGLVSEETAVQRLADDRAAVLGAGIYPLTFIWHSDCWSTVTNGLTEALRKRRPEGALDAAKDFMLDRLNDTREPLARPSGKPEELFRRGKADLIVAPNTRPLDANDASTASTHGGFHDDKATARAALRRILGAAPAKTDTLTLHRSARCGTAARPLAEGPKRPVSASLRRSWQGPHQSVP
jgi:hypothetical protein